MDYSLYIYVWMGKKMKKEKKTYINLNSKVEVKKVKTIKY